MRRLSRGCAPASDHVINARILVQGVGFQERVVRQSFQLFYIEIVLTCKVTQLGWRDEFAVVMGAFWQQSQDIFGTDDGE